MSIKNIINILLISLILMSCLFTYKQNKLSSYVNTFIGTGGHGHTFPGATMPFGMVQLSPDTRLEGWDGCSGYHYSDSTIYGFSHTHLSGTGVADYCDILIMPFVKDISNKTQVKKYYPSVFNHKNEKASPGFYSVVLDNSKIKVELTATLRAGFHRYVFPESKNSNIVVDLKHRDKVLESSIKITGNNKIEGMRRSKSWANNQVIYFVTEFSKPFTAYKIAINNKIQDSTVTAKGENLKAFFTFATNENEEILVKTGISAVSIEGARKNLEKEIPCWDFEKIKIAAENEWEKELSRIQVETKTQKDKVIFYTALYHSMIAPNIFNDVDGQYRGMDKHTHKTDGFDYYTVFSLWDTYRATHPLFTIIQQKRTCDFINTFIKQYEQDSLLPVWELAANETNCMIGYHAVSVIADAYMKGIANYDIEKAYQAAKASAMKNHFGLKSYKEKNYIPASDESESVSKTLEYAYDDWCIAQMAKILNYKNDYNKFIKRAQYYKNVFDASTGFMRAKNNETWFSPFDAKEVNFNYTEANAWQYSFYVPQDISSLGNLYGGKEKFAAKIDEMFNTETQTTGRKQADITGLIGQYAHGNEPSHHIAYLYNYLNQAWKTQEKISEIRNEMYNDKPDGLCGNEDCGQMSSWYVFGALGFYPVLPGSKQYVIGSPLFDEVVINLENGNKFTIIANNKTGKNIFIKSATLNGENYTKSYITHFAIMNGGTLIFEMTDKANKKWGTDNKDIPVSGISDNIIVPIPYVISDSKTFCDSLKIELKTITGDTRIYYTADNSEPDTTSALYSVSVLLHNTTTIKAKAYKQGLPPSKTIVAEFYKIPSGKTITLNTKYAGMYSAGGDMALIDHIRGAANFRTGAWQGYQGVDIDAVIDFGKPKKINKVSIGFIQDIGSWIFFPEYVDFYTSDNGKTFIKAGSVKNKHDIHNSNIYVQDFSVNVYPKTVRYVKIKAKNIGICPNWHLGAGHKAWIFADEIMIE